MIHKLKFSRSLGIANGGVKGGGFSAVVGKLGCFCEEICDCKGLEIDTPLAIATSGLRMNLLLQERPFPNTPHLIFPRSAIRVDT